MYAEWVNLELGDDVVARVLITCTPDTTREEKLARAMHKLAIAHDEETARRSGQWTADEILKREG